MSQALLSKIADEGIEYVDIRFTDPRGKLQHVTVCSDQVDQDFLDEGFMFDGSSIAGWKSIEESDMKLMPDVESAYVDPFYAEKTICIHCTVVEPDTGESYARDPRGCAQRAEAYLISSGIGDVAYMGPEAEFFLFDDVRFENKINKVSYEVDAVDASWNTDSDYEEEYNRVFYEPEEHSLTKYTISLCELYNKKIHGDENSDVLYHYLVHCRCKISKIFFNINSNDPCSSKQG